MLITVKLDVGPPKHSASRNQPNEHEKRKLKEEEEREARLDCWLGEGSERDPWNALTDARIG